ncbi:UNVERIFIED_CONTAM: putative mitochondrial protein [Sesamum radiatum]|uniref:Mitochondrial protein n=1 Tax=Sesamum radiatum TaxID=300843 RepID=A0AAW2PI84_SESRA
MIAGDFNEILNNSEKQGGRPRPVWQIRRFREALTLADVYDLGFDGGPFTWCNRHQEPDTIYERLDRACADPEWRSKFPNTVVKHIPIFSFDHSVLLINTKNNNTSARPKHKPFCFEATWASSPECEHVVREGWTSGQGLHQFPLLSKQKGCVARLKDWSRKGSASFKNRKCTGNNGVRFIGSAMGIETHHIFITEPVFGGGQMVSTGFEIVTGGRFGEGDGGNPRRVTEHMRQELLQPYTTEEVSKALSQMASLKSPGPDGIPPFIFQKYWHIVRNDVISSTLSFLNNLILPPELNHTHISLIPKCKKPETLTQFRSISVCNVAYKIASKTIANRLKPFLDSISPCQVAFVPDRLITDNLLLAFEVNHFLRTKRWGEKGHMALRLDISKAYDKRGLRHGDPLSPYLFLLCTETFSALLQKDERCGRLQGVAVCRQAPRVSHFLFADDTLIFCQATIDAALCILEGSLQIRVEARHNLYLGLPSVMGKSPRSVFQSIRDRIWNRICGWNERSFSQAGKEVLIKAVAQAIPTASWIDPWIPRPFSFRVLSRLSETDPNLLVSDLIDATAKEWNQAIIRDLFCPEDVEAILSIPLSSIGGEDFFVGTTLPPQASTVSVRIDTKVISRRWSPPGFGEIKLNFDGAVFGSSSKIGLGIIARNSDGVSVGRKSARRKGLPAPEMVEATAAREAILLAGRFGWRRIVLEGDCANLYFKLVSYQLDCSALGIITRDVKSLASAFDSCSFSLVRRSGNQVAHRLARQATTLASEGTSFPPFAF